MRIELTDEQWARIPERLPKPIAKPKGGRPRADDRAMGPPHRRPLARSAGLVPRTGDMPASPRRAERQDVWLTLWRAFLKGLDEGQQLDWSDAFTDRDLRSREKKGAGIGNTRKGKGTKPKALVHGHGIPLGVLLSPANLAESQLAEATVATVAAPRPGPGRPQQKPERIIADRGYDSRALWERFKARGIQLIVPHISTRKHRYQDGRCLRRYKRRWIIERTSAWLHAFRRLVTRDDNKLENYSALVHVACMLIALRQF